MAEIISLSKARKAKARVGKEAQATENRIVFGKTKAEREKAAALELLQTRKLDGHKRED